MDKQSRKYADNRLPISLLYENYLKLSEEFGWEREVMYELEGYPALTFKTKKKGRALYLTSGIHGEEPAGPVAISSSIKALAGIGEQFPVILRPLCNPVGYINNTRYFSGEGDWKKGQSVIELQSFKKNVKNNLKEYPPLISIDLHEEANPKVTSDTFYIYSQGKLGIKDPVAIKIFALLKSTGLNYLKKGKTRFGEPVVDGMIGPVNDGSFDEEMAKYATTSIVVETPTGVDLDTRVNAMKLIINNLLSFLLQNS